MRYIDIRAVIATIPQDVRNNLQAADGSMSVKSDAEKSTAVATRNGNRYWRPVKPYLDAASNGKCWYTESRNPGSYYDVDHYRPKAKVLSKDGTIKHWYWFLAFNPMNYRLSCELSNRPKANPVLGATGGKQDNFPLMQGSAYATDLARVAIERPVILDPCNQEDTELLAFQADGRPVASMRHEGDADTWFRVEQSKLLLNLDYPTFNEDRESLYNKIRELVDRGDRYIRESINAIEDVQNDLRALMNPDAEYSKAAECYIRCFRDRSWVEELVI